MACDHKYEEIKSIQTEAGVYTSEKNWLGYICPLCRRLLKKKVRVIKNV
jgi:hypothetical protein